MSWRHRGLLQGIIIEGPSFGERQGRCVPAFQVEVEDLVLFLLPYVVWP